MHTATTSSNNNKKDSTILINKQKVRVLCRVRPFNQKELSFGGQECVAEMSGSNISVVDGSGQNHSFTLDKVFAPGCLQAEVFREAAEPLVDDIMQGYNATIFAYGQTSSGKTFTMEGNDIYDSEQKGVIPRSVESIFKYVENSDANIEFTLKVSYIEIYMEKIRDLLDSNNVKVNLNIREDKVNGIYVAGVTEEYVTSQQEVSIISLYRYYYSQLYIYVLILL